MQMYNVSDPIYNELNTYTLLSIKCLFETTKHRLVYTILSIVVIHIRQHVKHHRKLM